MIELYTFSLIQVFSSIPRYNDFFFIHLCRATNSLHSWCHEISGSQKLTLTSRLRNIIPSKHPDISQVFCASRLGHDPLVCSSVCFFFPSFDLVEDFGPKVARNVRTFGWWFTGLNCKWRNWKKKRLGPSQLFGVGKWLKLEGAYKLKLGRFWKKLKIWFHHDFQASTLGWCLFSCAFSDVSTFSYDYIEAWASVWDPEELRYQPNFLASHDSFDFFLVFFFQVLISDAVLVENHVWGICLEGSQWKVFVRLLHRSRR